MNQEQRLTDRRNKRDKVRGRQMVEGNRRDRRDERQGRQDRDRKDKTENGDERLEKQGRRMRENGKHCPSNIMPKPPQSPKEYI